MRCGGLNMIGMPGAMCSRDGSACVDNGMHIDAASRDVEVVVVKRGVDGGLGEGEVMVVGSRPPLGARSWCSDDDIMMASRQQYKPHIAILKEEKSLRSNIPQPSAGIKKKGQASGVWLERWGGWWMMDVGENILPK
jgi:hypothetical protein